MQQPEPGGGVHAGNDEELRRAVLLPDQLRRMAEAYPDEVAYEVVDGGTLTFRQWEEQANQLARHLVTAGVAPDARVGIHLQMANALRFLVTYAAVHRAGGVAVPMNPRLAPAEIGHMLTHSGARGVVADGPLVDQDAGLGEIGPDGSRQPFFVVDATVSSNGDPATTATGQTATASDPAAPPGRGTEAAIRISWDEMVQGPADTFQVPRSDDDLADILYTSGTTGRPKGVAVRHTNASLVPEMPPSWNGQRWLHASPMFTFAGMSFVYNPMKLGMCGIYQPRFDAGRWLEVVAARRPTAVFLVPAMVSLLLQHPGFASADLSSIQMLSVGSAPLAPFMVEQLQARVPDALVSNNYGMTEAGSAYCIMPKGEAVKRPGSVGMPAPPALVRAFGEDGEELPPGEVGEIRIKVPGRSREYFADPEATASTWVDGWLHTGDLGKLDEDGYLYIVGRSKDVIIRGGNNVHAADVEHAVLAHPAVAEVAVVGAPHPVLGEDVVAFVVLRPGQSATPEELRAHSLERLADYKVPRRWELVDSLPRNPTGKVVKPELRRRLEAEAGAQAEAEVANGTANGGTTAGTGAGAN